MRRYIYIVLFFLVLVAPFLLRRAIGRGSEEPASLPGGRPAARLVIVTPHNQDIRREFERAFAVWHMERYGRAVAIDYRTPGGTNDIKRLLDATYRGFEAGRTKIDIHMAWGGGDFYFDQELKPLGVLQPVPIDPQFLKAALPEPTLAGVKLYDHALDEQGNELPPQWIGVCLSSFGIVYNPDLYRTLGLPEPKAWHDLTGEKLAGMVALADPTHSGSAAVAYMMVLQRAMADAEQAFVRDHPACASLSRQELARQPGYAEAIAAGWKKGMGDLLLIAANARYFTDSASQVPNDVGHGEAAAGMAIDFYGRVFQEAVGPDRVKFVSPVAATAITPDPIGILKGVSGEPLEVATHFVEFLLSPEGQKLWILRPGEPGGPRDRALRRPPVRPDVYADRGGWADDVNPFEEAGGFNQRGEWMVLFGDVRPVWAAAWIDGREALKEAYGRILPVEDGARRRQLIAMLADVPIAMRDVADLRAERKRVEKEEPARIDEWKARQRIGWAERFRSHYRRVGALAEE